MSTLIFDIETVGERWDALDETTQKSLTRWVDRTARNEEEHRARLADIKEGLGFSPLTGFIVSIAVFDLEREQGAVYFTAKTERPDTEADGFIYKQRTETAMLHDFWEGARAYDTFVTFNGRSFDVPFLLHRSVARGTQPTCDLMRRRYLSQQRPPYHIDLQDELTFYGAMYRRPSLHLFCRAYGIDSPKSDEVSGDMVSKLYHSGRTEEIARYNAADVIATTELYRRWQTYLRHDAEAEVPIEY